MILAVSGEHLRVFGFTADRIVFSSKEGGLRLDNGAALETPPGADKLVGGSRRNGEFLWWSTATHGVLRQDGSELMSLPPVARPRSVALDPSERPLASWTVEGKAGVYLTTPVADGSQTGLHIEEFVYGIGGWFDANRIFATVGLPGSIGGTPSLLDVTTGAAHPIEGIVGEPGQLPFGRNRALAVIHGPFARVVGTESCLNLRMAPMAASQVLDCLAGGVLLSHSDETASGEGLT